MRNKSEIPDVPVHVVNRICKWVMNELGIDPRNLKYKIRGVHVKHSKTAKKTTMKYSNPAYEKWRDSVDRWTGRRFKKIPPRADWLVLTMRGSGVTTYAVERPRATTAAERSVNDFIHCDTIETIIFLFAWSALRNTFGDGIDQTSRAARLVKLFRRDNEEFILNWYCPPVQRKTKQQGE